METEREEIKEETHELEDEEDEEVDDEEAWNEITFFSLKSSAVGVIMRRQNKIITASKKLI